MGGKSAVALAGQSTEVDKGRPLDLASWVLRLEVLVDKTGSLAQNTEGPQGQETREGRWGAPQEKACKKNSRMQQVIILSEQVRGRPAEELTNSKLDGKSKVVGRWQRVDRRQCGKVASEMTDESKLGMEVGVDRLKVSQTSINQR